MRRLVYHGYAASGKYLINVVEDHPGDYREETQIELTRAECQKILKHMQFGKKGEEKVIETLNATGRSPDPAGV